MGRRFAATLFPDRRLQSLDYTDMLESRPIAVTFSLFAAARRRALRTIGRLCPVIWRIALPSCCAAMGSGGWYLAPLFVNSCSKYRLPKERRRGAAAHRPGEGDTRPSRQKDACFGHHRRRHRTKSAAYDFLYRIPRRWHAIRAIGLAAITKGSASSRRRAGRDNRIGWIWAL